MIVLAGLGAGCGNKAAIKCTAKNTCYTAATNSDGACVQSMRAAGSPCDDGSPCTTGETCSAGVCGNGTVTACKVTDNVSTTIDLQGCSFGGYTAEVTLGDSQVLRLLVDSGSMDTVVAAKTCTNCDGVSPLYTPGDGAVNKGLNIQQSYGGGNGFTGAVYEDTMSLSSALPDVRLRLVAIEQQSVESTTTRPMFGTSGCSGEAEANPWQGLMGLAPAELGPAGTDSYISLMASQAVAPAAFAMQLCDVGGRMWLGGYDSAYTAAAPSFTPMDDHTGFYMVAIAAISVGQTNVGITQKQFGTTLVDSGTSLFVVADETLDAISDTLDKNANWVNDLGAGALKQGACFEATRSDVDERFPALSLSFPKVGGGFFAVSLPPSSSYLTPIYQGASKPLGFCVAITGGGSGLNAEPTNILGSAMMHALVAVFDLENGQMGFAPSRACTTTLQ